MCFDIFFFFYDFSLACILTNNLNSRRIFLKYIDLPIFSFLFLFFFSNVLRFPIWWVSFESNTREPRDYASVNRETGCCSIPASIIPSGVRFTLSYAFQKLPLAQIPGHSSGFFVVAMFRRFTETRASVRIGSLLFQVKRMRICKTVRSRADSYHYFPIKN